MRAITTREFRNASASVLDAVESGETVVISRNGVEIAEVRPTVKRRTFVPVAELMAAFRNLSAADSSDRSRADQDDWFGEDRL